MSREVRTPRRLVPGSIRFRLTAWYALLLTLVLAVLGVAVSEILASQLRNDVRDRLRTTAKEIDGALETSYPDGLDSDQAAKSLEPFADRNLYIQIVDIDNRVMQRIGPLGEGLPLGAPVSPGDTKDVERTDGDLLTLRHPIVVGKGQDKRTIGAIVVGDSLEQLDAAVAELRRLLIAASVIGLGSAVIGGWLLAGRALRPVDRVTATAAAIAAGDGSASSLTTRLAVPETGDEIARLAATFNAMLDRLEASFTAQRRFVADASHELRTPLTALRGNIEVLLDRTATGQLGPDDLPTALDDMEREGARMGRLLDDLLLLARADVPGALAPRRPGSVRLDLVAQDALRTARSLARGQELQVDADVPALVAGDPDRLLQLALILVDNALRHTPPGGRVTIAVAPDSGDRVRLVVRDTGEGIAPADLPHIFERFYRADRARARATGGTGLGLAIADEIARAHGGEIAVQSTPGSGSVFIVTLPLLRREGPPGVAPPTAAPASLGVGRVSRSGLDG
jgi:heavy metal sensor kinase